MVAFVREKEAPIEDRFCYWVGKDRYLNPRRIARQVSTSNPDYPLQTLVIDERGKRHSYQKDAVVARESLVRGSSLFRYLLDVSIATGSMDIYVMQREGGTPRRITTNSSNETPIAFKDNNTVLYTTQ